MSTVRPTPAAALLAPLLAALLPAQYRDHEGDHYTRPPQLLLRQNSALTQYSVASDAELTVALCKFESDQVVQAIATDGRALPGGWSPPTAVSSLGNVPRQVTRDSIHVIDELGIACWLDDAAGSNRTRLHLSRRVGGAWSAQAPVPHVGVPATLDYTAFAAVVKRGTNGLPHVVFLVAAVDTAANTPALFALVSADAGVSFRAATPVSASGFVPGGTATRVDSVSVDQQRGELHLAWVDDRSGTPHAYYRRGILDFFGRVLFAPPLGTTELQVSGSQRASDVIVAVNGEMRWTGSNQKYVGVAWREDTSSNGALAMRVRVSRDSGTNFGAIQTVAHTGRADVAVAAFDFEIVGDTFVGTWQDNASSDASGNVIVPSPPVQNVWRVESGDGASFARAGGAIVQRMSGQQTSPGQGLAPQIARSAGTPDGCMIAFVLRGAEGDEVATAFADQEFGGAWHGDEFPLVSDAQHKAAGVALGAPRLAYNPRYDNFTVVWAQESAPTSGRFGLMAGGYRPPQVEAEGWAAGSTQLSFVAEHLPFQDTFAFVMVSLSSAQPGPGFLLPDGRRSGLVPDALFALALDAFAFFVAPIDPVIEGAVTPDIPIPPNLPPGLALHCVAVTWGPFGDLHVVTEVSTAVIQ